MPPGQFLVEKDNQAYIGSCYTLQLMIDDEKLDILLATYEEDFSLLLF